MFKLNVCGSWYDMIHVYTVLAMIWYTRSLIWYDIYDPWYDIIYTVLDKIWCIRSLIWYDIYGPWFDMIYMYTVLDFTWYIRSLIWHDVYGEFLWVLETPPKCELVPWEGGVCASLIFLGAGCCLHRKRGVNMFPRGDTSVSFLM